MKIKIQSCFAGKENFFIISKFSEICSKIDLFDIISATLEEANLDDVEPVVKPSHRPLAGQKVII